MPRSGVGVDASGGPVIDPTANVIALNEAAQRRQDDLRAASERYLEAGLSHQKELADLRAVHAREIRELDTKRLDAIREVDVHAAQTEVKSIRDALQSLAATTQTTAESMRTTAVNTATTIANSIAETVAAMTVRIAALEKSSYEGAGKDAGPSAQVKELTDAIAALSLNASSSAGAGRGIKDLLGYIVGLGGLLLATVVYFSK